MLHPLTRTHQVPKQTFAELTAALEEANAVITSGELEWHKRRPGDTNTIWKDWGNIIQETSIPHLTTERNTDVVAMATPHPWDITAALPLTTKPVLSPSCAHRIGIFCLSYIPVIFSLSALFITESALHFSPVVFTSPNSWETFCILVFLNILFFN